MPAEPSTSTLTLDLTRLPPPSSFWPARGTPDVLPFQDATFDRAVIGLEVLNVSRLQRLFDDLGRVVVVGGEIEFVARDDDLVDGLKIRFPDMIAAILRGFDVHSITSNDGRVVIQARNRTARKPVDVRVETIDSTADAAAALMCMIRDRDIEQTVGDRSPTAGRPWRIDVANSNGTAAETVRFESASLPTGPTRRPDLRVAAVLGERSRSALRYEFALEPVWRDSWPAAFRPDPPHLLLVESSTPARGTGGPFTADGGLSRWTLDLLDRCRQHAVPTVFWNNDDPLSYESLLRSARHFDWVFTVDASCVGRYRTDLGHDRVGVLPFAIQPRIHNPVGAFSHTVGDIAYATSGHDADRRAEAEQIDNLLGATADLGLHILSLGESESRSGLPTGSENNVVSRLAYDQLLSAYRRYRILLSANPAPDSPTRLPPELLESLACGTPVISGPSSAIAPMLGSGVVEIGSDTSSSRMLVKALLASTELRDRKAVEGVRRVMRDHTYAGRVDDLLRTVGLDAAPRARPLVSIVAPTHRLGGYESIIRNAGRQTYRDFELILGLHGVDEPESRIRDVARDQGLHNLTIVRLPSERSLGSVCNELIEAASGTHVARMDDDDFYGAHYLEDQMRAFEYTEADVVGKWTRFIYLEKLPALGVIFPGNEHVYGPPLCGGTLLMRRDLCDAVKFADRTRGEDIAFLIDCARQGCATYATDRFNYVYVRHADKSRHTYQPDDLDLLSRTRIVSFGSSLEHAFV
ncbi:glycosyltransferase [Plantactinospora sp. KLBMP9567]|uniref:glycosyltransferase family protein n=1 Tax=Plantactinospora sp. KLBMP9567 TaxID=3085900 RepID=UPI00298271A9|nr:glycosyltransferase [Plantactinospora sp. KLBMP9567]MDW5328814.1 glycosyltransferase [Plantactinospora sp. KLBMP9567]